MANLSDLEDQTDPIVKAIYEQYEKKEALEQSRGYIGASVIGKECKRSLWYAFRWVDREQFDGRMLRLFQTGHLEEPRLVADLRSIGAEVWDCDPATGKQFSAKDHGGHMRGHCDGVARNIPSTDRSPHLLEFKTHASKSFAELVKKGLKDAKPVHYWQMQWYMGQMGLQKGLYMAKNKDNDELYASCVQFDAELFEKIQRKAASIIYSSSPPEKIHTDGKYYVCGMCSFKDVCHGVKPPKFSCRTCVHATPEKEGDGTWSCPKKGELSIERQLAGCEEHLVLPDLINFAEAIDSGDDWIKYRRKNNGREFIVGFLDTDLPMYTSNEICSAADHNAICNEEMDLIRKHFNATIAG